MTTPQPPAKSEDTGAVPSIDMVLDWKVNLMVNEALLQGIVNSNRGVHITEEMVKKARKQAKAQLETLIQQRELSARIDELKNRLGEAEFDDVPLDIIHWKALRIAELKRQQTEALKGEL